MKRAVRALVAAALLQLPVAAPAVRAESDLHFAGDVAGLWLWEGEQRSHTHGQVLASGFAERLHLGGEVEHLRYEADLLGLRRTDVNAYNARAIASVLFFPRQVSPYLGLGAGLNLVHLDDTRTRPVGRGDLDTVGVTAGGIGFAGLHWPIGPGVTVFSEARGVVAFDVADQVDDALGVEDLSGVTGLAGLRVRF